jgi:uncharacterized Zn finger protein
MADEKLPRLTEAHIRNLALGSSFERGQNYYRDGAVFGAVRQGMELRAQCEGSDYEPYQVSATLKESGIAETSCTCPYDYGGICKHIVALLLTYIKDPQSFRSIPPLTELQAVECGANRGSVRKGIGYKNGYRARKHERPPTSDGRKCAIYCR